MSLSWTASAGATSYNVKRGTVSGGPYATIISPTATSAIDTGSAPTAQSIFMWFGGELRGAEREFRQRECDARAQHG